MARSKDDKVIIGASVGEECLVKRGRPTKDKEERRSIGYTGWFTRSEAVIVERGIKHEGVSASEFVRKAVISRVMGGGGAK